MWALPVPVGAQQVLIDKSGQAVRREGPNTRDQLPHPGEPDEVLGSEEVGHDDLHSAAQDDIDVVMVRVVAVENDLTRHGGYRLGDGIELVPIGQRPTAEEFEELPSNGPTWSG
jgi:hypothetical protein